jgi:hypothetical protein
MSSARSIFLRYGYDLYDDGSEAEAFSVLKEEQTAFMVTLIGGYSGPWKIPSEGRKCTSKTALYGSPHSAWIRVASRSGAFEVRASWSLFLFSFGFDQA